MKALLARYEAALRERCPHYIEALAPPAGDRELSQLADALGRSVPDELRAILQWHDGELDRPLLPGRVTRSRWDLPLVDSLLTCEQIASSAVLLREVWEDQHEDWKRDGFKYWDPSWTPLMGRGEVSLLCLNAENHLIQWAHGEGMREVVAPSIRAWLGALVEMLEAGLVRERPSVVEGDGFRIDLWDPAEPDWNYRQKMFLKKFRHVIKAHSRS
jgi:cell wall assembly regulator SMI1